MSGPRGELYGMKNNAGGQRDSGQRRGLRCCGAGENQGHPP
ncbi:hypothetical protein SLEP1_g57627 [Rubroshorea leprosula]|uniref:Uncharacterized protein n=1 Tax=Rubroshorea leprosula TaxID=152421 RepID=A0AAV5MM42_9ROSI|nr:hypothetical protein SLEP1_g57627 [Rubroshorea leprosula]